MTSLSLSKVYSYFNLTDFSKSSNFLFCSFKRQIYLFWFVLSSFICLFNSSSFDGLYLILGSSLILPVFNTELFYLNMLKFPFFLFLFAAWMLSCIKFKIPHYRLSVLHYWQHCKEDASRVVLEIPPLILPSWELLQHLETNC